MRQTILTIAIAAAIFAATLAFAPTLADAAQHLELSHFLSAPEKAPVTVADQEQKPNCSNPLAKLADALGKKACLQ